jgi:PDZ domain-containing protein
MDTSNEMVSPVGAAPGAPGAPPAPARYADDARAPDHRHHWWALPVLTIGGLLLVVTLGAAFVPLQRWAVAPGSAQAVADRVEFDDVARYESDGDVLFVTASGPQLSALESVVGWVDPNIEVQTYEEKFGPRTPAEQQEIGFQAMISSKQTAEYVAFSRLGFPTELVPGPAAVSEVICPDVRPELGACNVLDVGDTIEAIDGTLTPVLDDVPAAIEGKAPGDQVVLTVRPHAADTTEERTVELIASPDDPAKTIVGFVPADTRTVELPFEVDIDTDRIGGPSAGLAFTLTLLDELTPGSLTGGEVVAATGTIDTEGNVGAIGALPQKTLAVIDAGAKVFLVPTAQGEEEIARVQELAGDRLRVVPVATLDEALAVLAELGGNALELGTPGADWPTA